MKNLSIRVKLFGLVIVLLSLTSGIGIFGMISTHNIIAHLEEDAHKEQELAHTLELAEVTEIEFKSQIIEWQNILLRGNDPKLYNLHKKKFIKQSDTVIKDLGKLTEKFKKLNLDDAEIKNVLNLHEVMNAKYLSALKKFSIDNAGSGKEVDRLVVGIDKPVTLALEKMAHNLSAEIDNVIKLSEAYAADTEANTKLIDIVMIVGAVFIGLILGWFLIRSIVNPLNEIVKVTQRLAEGDMTVEVKVVGKSEISKLQHSILTMTEKLRSVLSKVNVGANSVSGSADEISEGNLSLSSRTEEQAASLEETSASMAQVTERVEHNSQAAVQAVSLANTATSKAEEGLEVAKTAVSAINDIKKSSEQVADIIGVIDEIAFQTNLLALNASIEAERAGEQGRGFSVVANEVQKLAQRSADAASEIKGLIKDSSMKVTEGTEFVISLSQALEDIVGTSNETNELMQNISAISKEQAVSLREINTAVKQLDETTQENAALVEETSAASSSMSEQAKTLSDLVSFFKLQKGAVSSEGLATPSIQSNAGQIRDNVPSNQSAANMASQPALRTGTGRNSEWEEF